MYRYVSADIRTTNLFLARQTSNPLRHDRGATIEMTKLSWFIGYFFKQSIQYFRKGMGKQNGEGEKKRPPLPFHYIYFLNQGDPGWKE